MTGSVKLRTAQWATLNDYYGSFASIDTTGGQRSFAASRREKFGNAKPDVRTANFWLPDLERIERFLEIESQLRPTNLGRVKCL